jgi:hypothetical protein
MATILLHLYLNHGACLYNYWCNTINNQALCKDVMWWGTFLLCSSITLSLYFLNVFLKLVVASVQRTSVWSLLSFWPQLCLEIIVNSKRLTFWEILPNLHYFTPTTHARAQISCYTHQNFLDKGKACIIPSHPLPGISSGYQTYGAYANIAETHANESTKVVSSATKRIYRDDPL